MDQVRIVKFQDETIHFKNGKRHREDGPAVIGISSSAWFLEGEVVTSASVFQKVLGLSDEVMTFLLLKHGDIDPDPKYETYEGDDEEWYDENGEFHREDGPARVTCVLEYQWYKHGLLHREDGPAVYYADYDYEEWWIDGVMTCALGGDVEYAIEDEALDEV